MAPLGGDGWYNIEDSDGDGLTLSDEGLRKLRSAINEVLGDVEECSEWHWEPERR